MYKITFTIVVYVIRNFVKSDIHLSTRKNSRARGSIKRVQHKAAVPCRFWVYNRAPKIVTLKLWWRRDAVSARRHCSGHRSGGRRARVRAAKQPFPPPVLYRSARLAQDSWLLCSSLLNIVKLSNYTVSIIIIS